MGRVARGGCSRRVRAAVAVAAALALVLTGLLTLDFGVPLAFAQPASSSSRGAEQRYGPDFDSVKKAIDASGWPQQDHIWCGLAAADAVINWKKPFISQHDLANWLNTDPARSTWGTPAPNPAIAWGPGFGADISRDVGTDPRSIAIGQSLKTGSSYHTVVDRISAQDATKHLIADLVRSNEPIHAIVFRGGHSVIVSGVRATGDPIKDPGSITALEVWDPGFGIYNGNIQPAQMTLVSLDQWYTNKYYWSSPYDEDFHGNIAQDPDPAVGPYAYDPNNGQSAHLWVGNFVYMRPDPAGDPMTKVSQDWAFNQDGDLIAGAKGDIPDEWAGPVVALDSDKIIRDATPAFNNNGQQQDQQGQQTQQQTGGNSSKPFITCSAAICRIADPRHWWLLGLPLLLIAGLVVVAAMRAEVRTTRAAKRVVDTRKHRAIQQSRLWDERWDDAPADPNAAGARWPAPPPDATRRPSAQYPAAPNRPPGQPPSGRTTNRIPRVDDDR